MFGYVWYSALLLGVPSCEQYPSQPLFPNLWDSNIHWVGLGVNLPETMVVFPMKKRGSCDFSLPIHWNINDPFPLSHAHNACLLKFHKEAPGVAVPFDRKRVVTFKCLKDVIYIYEWRTKWLTTHYSQWTWPKWVIPYRLWRFVLPCYV